MARLLDRFPLSSLLGPIRFCGGRHQALGPQRARGEWVFDDCGGVGEILMQESVTICFALDRTGERFSTQPGGLK